MKCGYDFFPLAYFLQELLKALGQNFTREVSLKDFILT